MSGTSVRARVAIVALCVVTAVAVASCTWNPDVDTRSATQGLPDTKVDLVAGAWRLDVAASTPELASTAGSDSAEKGGKGGVTLDFHADGTASGRGPCNSFTAQVDYADDEVHLTNLASTMMACEPDVMDDETAFHEALASVRSVEFSGDHDRLTLSGGDARLVFDSFDPHHK